MNSDDIFKDYDEGDESKNHVKSWIKRTCKVCLEIFYTTEAENEKVCKKCQKNT